MAFSPGPKSVDVSLETFAGLVTELTATDLPPGVSPDCGDVGFFPGSTFSRPGLRRLFAPISGKPTVTYAKSYVDNTGAIRNLYLDTSGALWVENFSLSPGILDFLVQTTPNCYAKSVTAFGREYIAISDGLHGQESPLQYDGTYLDRVTQDGPGAPPIVVSLSLPSVAMAATGAPSTLAISECDPAAPDGGGNFTAINVFVNGSLGSLNVGDTVTISGSVSPFNATFPVIAVYDGGTAPTSLFVVAAYLPAGTAFALGGTATIGSGTTMRRSSNVVTVKTTSAHGLKVGYQAQITGIPAATVGTSIATVVINNEDQPGLATITTAAAHGLVPGLYVSLLGIVGASVGGGISTVSRQGNIVTVVTASAHGLSPGAEITIAGVGTGSFNTTTTVAQIASTTSFTYYQVDADATATGGTVTLLWPIPASATPQYFEVVSAPTSTTFQVQIAYSDGSWTGGTVKYAWDGTFFVSAVLSSTEFQYQQYGPNATSSTIGTVTPYGQMSPGQHQVQLLFLTRQGYVTRPSPPVKFTANGGQFLSVSNIATGPPNVLARILAFTGAQGGQFYYIPTPAQVAGQVVSTATQIDDNSTTNAILDFSDNTLYASLGISIPGNTCANQIVIDSALGFGFYDSRLMTYGQRNTVTNLLNMGFDGGVLPTAPTLPCGWVSPGGGGVLAAGHFGWGWNIPLAPGGPVGQLSQSFYLDAYGAPIGTPRTPYRARIWAKLSGASAGVTFTVAITSTSTGFASYATFPGANMSIAGAWLDAAFSAPMPDPIPPDMMLTIYGESTSATVGLLVDELSIIYAENPYQETVAFASYANNPEAFDGLTGKFGAVNDTRKLMDWAIIRNSLCILTQDPAGRLHRIADNGTTEPAGWTVDEMGANCGALSAFGLTKSQADDSSAGGGEEWFAWASSSGARLYGGANPWKISQEIQPDWSGDAVRGFKGINFAEGKTIWAVNDPVERIIYFGVPSLDVAANPLTPNLILTVSYRQLDTAAQIAAADPVHTSMQGKLVATDNKRKWSRWHVAAACGALVYREPDKLAVTFGGAGNVYMLDGSKLTDDDFGQIRSYYTVCFFPSHDMEQALQLGVWRKLVTYLMSQISGVGDVKITALCNALANPWPISCIRPLQDDPKHDLEWTGGNATANRIAFRIESLPAAGQTDNQFLLQKVAARMRPARLLVRGAL